MSKKQQRVSWLVGCRNALNNQGERGVDDVLEGKIVYDFELIERVIGTLDCLLANDGVFPFQDKEKSK